MEAFSALLALCGGNSPVTWPVNSPHKGPVTRSFGVFLDLCLNKRLSELSWGWWFETPWSSLWRHCNEKIYFEISSEKCRPFCSGLKVFIAIKWVQLICCTVSVLENIREKGSFSKRLSGIYWFPVVIKQCDASFYSSPPSGAVSQWI